MTERHRVGDLAKALGFGGLVLFVSLAASSARAAEYYVATTGSDANAGTMAAPFASLQKGHDVAVAGDTVWIRGGTYRVVTAKSAMSGFTISRSGQSDTARIKFWAYPGEQPIFDFSQVAISSSQTSAGIYVTGSWLHFKGLEIANVPMPGTRSNNGIWNNGGSNNIFELLHIHHISGPGLVIANGNGGHLVLNCDSHDNYDPNSDQGAGQNADGFGCHYQTSGPSTIFRGCRAWWNSDDGYDLISQEVPVTIDNCWAMGSGFINSGTARPGSGNGNGFKAGSSKTGIRHTITNSLAWKNAAAGFYANHSSGGNNWYNNTSYNNGTQYNMLASPATDSSVTIILSGTLVHRMRNNIGFPDKNSNMGGVDTAFNTWDLGIVPSANDFVGVTDTGFMGPRQADGSLPALDFMKLRAGSALIDKGTNVGLPFVGAAPDLGAYEFGATPTAGTGGASGSGGRSGTGGGTVGGGGTAGVGGGPTGSGGGTGTIGGTGGSGGAIAVAGRSGTAGTGGGGIVVAATGGAGAGAVAGQRGVGVDSPSAAGGCACAIDASIDAFSGHGSRGSRGSPGGFFTMLGVLSLLRRRRRRRR